MKQPHFFTVGMQAVPTATGTERHQGEIGTVRAVGPCAAGEAAQLGQHVELLFADGTVSTYHALELAPWITTIPHTHGRTIE